MGCAPLVAGGCSRGLGQRGLQAGKWSLLGQGPTLRTCQGDCAVPRLLQPACSTEHSVVMCALGNDLARVQHMQETDADAQELHGSHIAAG